MRNGFTLFEILIVLAIFIVIAIIFTPVAFNLYRESEFNKSVTEVVWALREARDSAISSNDSAFGVCVQNEHEIVIFQGESCSQISVEKGQVNLPSYVVLSGEAEIIFEPKSGLPKNIGSLFLKSGKSIKEVEINSMGSINF